MLLYLLITCSEISVMENDMRLLPSKAPPILDIVENINQRILLIIGISEPFESIPNSRLDMVKLDNIQNITGNTINIG